MKSRCARMDDDLDFTNLSGQKRTLEEASVDVPPVAASSVSDAKTHPRGTAAPSSSSLPIRPQPAGVKFEVVYQDILYRVDATSLICLAPKGTKKVAACGKTIQLGKAGGISNFIAHLENEHPHELCETHVKKVLGGPPSTTEAETANPVQGLWDQSAKVKKKKTASSISKGEVKEVLATLALRSTVATYFFASMPFREALVALGVSEDSIPSYNTIRNRMTTQFNDAKEAAIQDIKRAAPPLLAFVMDGGNRRAYQNPVVALSLSALSDDGIVVNRAVYFARLGYPHTSEALAAARNTAVKESLGESWLSRVVFAVHDAAPNNGGMAKLATRGMDHMPIYCVVHTLNNAVKMAFERCAPLSTLLGFCQTVIKAFMEHPKALQQFKQKQLEMPPPAGSKADGKVKAALVFIQPVETRFFSSVMAIDRVIELMPALMYCLPELDTMFTAAKTTVDVGVLQQAIRDIAARISASVETRRLLFRVSQWATLLSGRDYVTLDMVLPMLHDLAHEFNAMMLTPRDDHTVSVQDKQFAGAFSTALTHYFNEWVEADIYLLANLLGVRAFVGMGGNVPAEDPLPPYPERRSRGRPTNVSLSKKNAFYGAARAGVVDPQAFVDAMGDNVYAPFIVKPPQGQAMLNLLTNAVQLYVYGVEHPYPTSLPDVEPAAPEDEEEEVREAVVDDGYADFMRAAEAEAAKSSRVRVRPPTLVALQTKWTEDWQSFKAAVALPELKAFAAQVYKLNITPDNFSSSPYSVFWASRKALFPTVWKLARVVLSPPASSICVESLFSVMGAVDAPRRAALKDEQIGRIVLANSWAGSLSRPRKTKIEWPIPCTDLSNALLKDLYSSDYVTDLVSGDLDTPEADEDLTVETDEVEDVDVFLASIGVEVPVGVGGGAGGGAGGRK